jgi:hypothetical protein
LTPDDPREGIKATLNDIIAKAQAQLAALEEAEKTGIPLRQTQTGSGSSFEKPCNFCGAKIRLERWADKRWHAVNLDGTAHRCRS